MTEHNRKPEIRFAGFSGDWEQRKLGELATFSKGRGYSKKDLKETGTPIILYGRLYTKYQTVISKVDTFAVDIPGSVYSSGNEVIVPSSGETAEDIARASVVKKSGILLGGDLNIIHPNEDINSAFLAISISNGERQKELVKRAQGKSVVHLYNTDLQEVEVAHPGLSEQKRVGELFCHYDRLITLQQQKYDKLMTIKKSMLDKMFPKDGADVPEVRFGGCTDAWEQRKLGEMVEFNPKAHLPDVFLYVDLESVVGTEMISHRAETIETAPSRAQRLAKKGDLFYQTVRPYQKNNYLFDKPWGNYVFSTGYAQMRPQNDGYFLLCLVQTESFVKDVLDRCTGTSYPAINASDLSNMEIAIPLELNEEAKISTFFKNLDNLITLQRQKVDKLKSIKQAMLDKMFV